MAQCCSDLSPICLKWSPMCWWGGGMKRCPFPESGLGWAGFPSFIVLGAEGWLCEESQPAEWPRGHQAMFPPWIQIGLAAGEASVADNGLTTSSTNRYDLAVLTGMWNAGPSVRASLLELGATWKIKTSRITAVRPTSGWQGAPEILWSVIADSPPDPQEKHVYRTLKIKANFCRVGQPLKGVAPAEWPWVISFYPYDTEVNEPGTIWALGQCGSLPLSPLEFNNR